MKIKFLLIIVAIFSIAVVVFILYTNKSINTADSSQIIISQKGKAIQQKIECAMLNFYFPDYANDYKNPPFPPVEKKESFALPRWGKNSNENSMNIIAYRSNRYNINVMLEFLKKDNLDYHYDIKIVINGQTYHFPDLIYSGENKITLMRGHNFTIDITRN